MECESPLKRQRKTISTVASKDNPLVTPWRYDTGVLSSHANRPCIGTIDELLSYLTAVLTSLQQAFTTQQRLCSLKQLLQCLSYDPTTRVCSCPSIIISQQFRAELVQLLCMHLGSSLHGHCDSLNSQVVELSLRSLEVAYRYNPDLVTENQSIRQGEEVLRLLSLVYQHTITIHSDTSTYRSSSAMLILSIWHSFSSSSLGSSLLLKRPDTLSILGDILSSIKSSGKDERCISMEGLGLLKNMTYYGEDYRRRIVMQVDLISWLSTLGHTSNDKVLERLSAIFRNLALSTDVRLTLAQRSEVLTSLVYMAGKGNGIGNNSHKHILRNVMSTLTNLAMDANSTNMLLYHGDGILVKQLAQFIAHPDDVVVRKRAAKTLRLLSRDTASVSPMTVLLQDQQILGKLSYHAIYDPDEGVRNEAQEAFAKCATLIQAPMLEYQAVLDTLTQMTTMKSTVNVASSADIVARALREQSSRSENRRSMGQRQDLAEGLAKILTSSDASLLAKDNVCLTLLDLSSETDNHMTLASPPILEALVQTLMDRRAAATHEIGSTRSRIRVSIVRFILNLSKTSETCKRMAGQTSLIQSLLQFATSHSTNYELKNQVKDVILRLAAEL
jgi:hypothetical protein